jgi:hypothetical protein
VCSLPRSSNRPAHDRVMTTIAFEDGKPAIPSQLPSDSRVFAITAGWHNIESERRTGPAVAPRSGEVLRMRHTRSGDTSQLKNQSNKEFDWLLVGRTFQAGS